MAEVLDKLHEGAAREAAKVVGVKEQSDAAKIAGEFRQHLKEKGERITLEKMRAQARGEVPVETPEEKAKREAEMTANREAAINRNIQGTTVDQDLKRVDVANAAKQAEALIRDGFDKIPLTEQGPILAQATASLETSIWSSETYKKLTAAEQEELRKQLLQSEGFQETLRAEYQAVLAEQVTDDQKRERYQQLLDRGEPDDPRTWEKAAGQLEDEWHERVQTVIQTATRKHLEALNREADEFVTAKATALDAEAGKAREQSAPLDVARRLEQRWSPKNREIIRNDFDVLANGGVMGILDSLGLDPKDKQVILDNPAMLQKYEQQAIESLITKRLRTGGLNRNDFYRLVDAPWCGVEKMTQIIKNFSEIEKLRKDMERSGQVDITWTDRIKGMPPGVAKGVLFTGLLACLLGGRYLLGDGSKLPNGQRWAAA